MNIQETENYKRTQDQIEQEEIGRTIAHLLGLKKLRNYGTGIRYDTAWGTKTDLGLYLTIKRVIDEKIKTQ
jgi:hypothetical protein